MRIMIHPNHSELNPEQPGSEDTGLSHSRVIRDEMNMDDKRFESRKHTHVGKKGQTNIIDSEGF